MRAERPQAGGRFLEEEDIRLRRHVAFIGTEVQRKLFAGIPAVGETIRIAGQPFEIVGVMEEKVQLSNYNRPDKYCVFIPWTTMGALSYNRYVGTSCGRRCRRCWRRRRWFRCVSSWPNAIATIRPTCER